MAEPDVPALLEADSLLQDSDLEALAQLQPSVEKKKETLEEILAEGEAVWLSQKRSGLCWKFFRPIVEGFLKGKKDAKLPIYCAICGPPLKYPSDKVHKGVVHYHHSSGTSGLSSHLLRFHSELWGKAMELEKRHEEKPEAASKRRKIERPTPGQMKISPFLATGQAPEFWASDDPRQIDITQSITRWIAKCYLPLSIVEHVEGIEVFRKLNPCYRLPSRKQITQKWVPEMAKETVQRFVLPRLKECVTGTMTYDLWMSRGAEDIFGLVWHFVDAQWKPVHICLGLVHVASATGVVIGEGLLKLLERFNAVDLTQRALAENSDGGSNLQTMRRAVADDLSCKVFPSIERFVGRCYGHIFSNIISSSCLDDNVTKSLDLIDLSATFKTFSSCIRWPRKSAPARCQWHRFCRKHGLSERLPPSPVNTRMASRIVFLQDCLTYEAVIRDLYSQPQLDYKFAKRMPKPEQWKIAQVLVDTLKRPVELCFLNQTRGYWLLSDAIVRAVTLLKKSHATCEEARLEFEQHEPKSGFPYQLIALRFNVSAWIYSKLKAQLTWCYRFEAPSALNAFALMLHPTYRNMEILQDLPGLSAEQFQTLMREYNSYLLSMINDAERYLFPSVTKTTLWDTDEATGGRELANWRRGAIPVLSDANALFAYWQAQESKFPTLGFVARAVYGVPASQIEVERLFSVAGHLTALRRASMADETLNELVMINQNWPSDPRIPLPATWDELLEREGEIIEDMTREELGDYSKTLRKFPEQASCNRPENRGSPGPE